MDFLIFLLGLIIVGLIIGKIFFLAGFMKEERKLLRKYLNRLK